LTCPRELSETLTTVDLAAEALVRTGTRPFPQLLAQITGGSLSTLTALPGLVHRFAFRGVDPATPELELPTQVTLRVRHLLAGVESAIREQLCDLTESQVVLEAAAGLGERQALKAEITALQPTRKRLEDELAATTYRVSELDTRLEAALQARAAGAEALQGAVEQLQQAVQHTHAKLDAAVTKLPDHAIQRLSREVHRLSAQLTAKSSQTRRAQADRAPAYSRTLAPQAAASAPLRANDQGQPPSSPNLANRGDGQLPE
jgi:uncharacterized protein YoxC